MDLEHIAARIALGVKALDARFGGTDGVGQGAEIQSPPLRQAVCPVEYQLGIVIDIDAGDITFQVPERRRAGTVEVFHSEQILLKMGVEAIL